MDIENSQSGSKNMASVSDDGLYNLCKQYGERARIWRQRFAGLLPEVFRRKLYEKKGFISIFEFAKKLAGMSEEQVRLVLNLEKRFSETPTLKTLLTSGKVSINKLARVVSIVTPENEKFLAMQVQVLSKNAVETLVRDEKFAKTNDKKDQNNLLDNSKNYNQNGLFEPETTSESLPGQMCFDTKIEKSNCENSTENFKNIFTSKTLNLNPEIQEKLLELQQKGIDINELLKEFLQKREEEIAQRKAEIAKKMAEKNENLMTKSGMRISEANAERVVVTSPFRHIPISIKRILQQEHGMKCSIKNCQKLSEQIHHTQRFSLAQSHDPHYLAPLCREHHELAHSMDNDYIEIRKRACR